MNGLQAFKNEQFGEVRVIEQNGAPWFVAADVCKALDIANPTDAIKRLDEDEKATRHMPASAAWWMGSVNNAPLSCTVSLLDFRQSCNTR